MKYCKLRTRFGSRISVGRFMTALTAVVAIALLAGLPILSGDSRGSRFVRLDFIPGSVEADSEKMNGRYILSF
ncbi:MAG TPA: hypothetical protein PKM56_18615, partial [Candidatus Rifleibacterium sp.]|nr:hypothetical protein [Candidatus Rifleibacterium sp.]